MLAEDAIFCIARAAVLGVIMSCEAMAVRRLRKGFGRHVLLFLGFSALLTAEMLYLMLSTAGVGKRRQSIVQPLVFYPVVTSYGLLALRFALEYASGRWRGESLRRRSRWYVLLALMAGIVLAGVVLASQSLPTRPEAMSGIAAPTSWSHLGPLSVLLHGIHVAAAAALLAAGISFRKALFTEREARMFFIGCTSAILGAAVQVLVGPREHLSTLAYAILVTVFVRSFYREAELAAVRAVEDRSARMLMFHRVTTRLKSSFDLPQLYDTLLESLMSTLAAESAALFLLEPDGKHLRVAGILGPFPLALLGNSTIRAAARREDGPLSPREAVISARIPLGTGLAGAVAARKEAICVYDASQHPLLAGTLSEQPPGGAASTRIQSTIALPLRSQKGLYGVVQVVNRLDGRPFDEDDIRFMSLIAEQAGMAIHNARLHHEMIEQQHAAEEIKVARGVQLKLIPSRWPKVPGLDLHAFYRAAHDVGGDYYDFLKIDENRLGIILADVSGKGVPGALIMIMTRTILRMLASQSKSAAETLAALNAALEPEIRRGIFVTAVYAVVDVKGREMALASAGHDPVLICRAGDRRCTFHKPRGAALGLLPPDRFRELMQEEKVTLNPGDTVLFYTDGVTEAINSLGEPFGETRLSAIVTSLCGADPKAILDAILMEVDRHTGEMAQYDDISMVAIQLKDEP